MRGSRPLQAVLLGMKQADKTVRNDINKDARKKAGPVWQEALRGHTTTRLEVRALLPGARVGIGVRSIKLTAATSRRPLRGGLVPSSDFAAIEYGARERKHQSPMTSPKGTRYTVNRITGRQFRPRSRGYVVNPAAGTAGKRIVALWVKTVYDGFSAAARGR
ncbi:hypothetical protein [Rathayibacter sp. AY1C9]|uniref:hypothetical protein n=1 Tax=Rathayibacter sp. AY1C9 TaxID=2080541 RepID=UPI0011AFECA2|nr:hypothetical protein [Rathayibacter sp. AY1C9]